MEKVVCIDLDDTFFNFVGPFVKFCQKVIKDESIKKSLSEGTSKWRSWDGWANYGLTREQFDSLLTRFYKGGGLRTLPVCVKSYHELNELVENGWKVVFVTKRPSFTIWQSVDHLRTDLELNFHSLYCVDKENGSMVYHFDKDEIEPIAAESKKDIFIILDPIAVFDDAPQYVEEAIEAKVPHIYMVNRTHNANWRRANAKFKKVECVNPTSWGYLIGHIEELEKKYG